MQSSLEDRFQSLKEKVLAKKPILREILGKRGTKFLFDYARLYYDVNLNPPIQKRQDEFISTIGREVSKQLSQKVSHSVMEQLKNYYFVSTADHHGPICHPFFLNSNLLTAAPHFENADLSLNNVIVLACGSVSLNNSSYPRGLIFHTFVNGKIELQRLSFFPASDRLCPVYNYRSYNGADIDRVKVNLGQLLQQKKIHKEQADKILEVLDEIYLNPKILASDNYSDQISKTNFFLWKKFFDSSGNEPPDLVYLEQESFVNRLLIDNHIDKHTIMSHFLFDREYDSMVGHYFDGITGAFSFKDRWGTYLFWALPKGTKYRIQLWKEGNELVSKDGLYRIALEPEIITKALEEKELIPGMMLCYIVLSFYYGLKCLGGFSQVNYLTDLKNAYIKMQVDLGNYKSIEVCARAQTKEIGGDFTLSFLSGPGGEMLPATGLDLILYGDKKTWQRIVDESKTITLEEGINPLMPEFYRIVYPESERDPDLMSVTDLDITRITNLDKKVQPCVYIKTD